ncbi:MAG: DNA-processing protein DprA [Exilispira sp.]
MSLLKKNDLEYILAYSIIPYELFTPLQKIQLLCYFDFDIKRIFNSDIEQIKNLLAKNKNFNINFYQYLKKARLLINKKVKFITFDSKYFPFECWKNLTENSKDINNHLKTYPFLLFYEGDISILSTDKISVIGTRKPSEISIEFTSHIVKEIKRTVVSGFASGIDHFAHLYAIQNNLPTIAIFASGTNIIYPKSNLELYKNLTQNNFLILSEFPPDTLPKKYYFPIRNRIISALSEKIICIQASKKSGALITTSYAKEMNKKIYVFYPIELDGFEGNKNLFTSNDASLLFGAYKGKLFIKKYSSLTDNFEDMNVNNLNNDNSHNNEEIELNMDSVQFNYINNYENKAKEFELLKEIFIDPNRSLEYYSHKVKMDARNIILAYQLLIEKKLIKIDNFNRIYPNYSSNILQFAVK